MKRRGFIKKAFGFISALVSAPIILGESLKDSDYPPMPPVKPPKDDEERVSDILFNTVKRGKTTFTELSQWHHFVYNRVGSVEEIYVDGKKVSLVFTAVLCDVLSSDKNCEIKDYYFTINKVGNVVEQKFRFRNKNNA